MSKKNKLISKFLTKPFRNDISFDDLATVMKYFGFSRVEGKGSRVKFNNSETGVAIYLHRPHPSKFLKEYQVKIVYRILNKVFHG